MGREVCPPHLSPFTPPSHHTPLLSFPGTRHVSRPRGARPPPFLHASPDEVRCGQFASQTGDYCDLPSFEASSEVVTIATPCHRTVHSRTEPHHAVPPPRPCSQPIPRHLFDPCLPCPLPSCPFLSHFYTSTPRYARVLRRDVHSQSILSASQLLTTIIQLRKVCNHPKILLSQQASYLAPLPTPLSPHTPPHKPLGRMHVGGGGWTPLKCSLHCHSTSHP